MDWKVEYGSDDLPHVYPLDDLREHFLDADCECRPKLLQVHSSWDRREEGERRRAVN